MLHDIVCYDVGCYFSSDCVYVLSQCVEWQHLPADQTPQQLCNLLSPNNDEHCIPLSNFLSEYRSSSGKIQLLQWYHTQSGNIGYSCERLSSCLSQMSAPPYLAGVSSIK